MLSMSFVLYLFGSGLAFWLGAMLVLAGFLARVFAKQRWVDRTGVYAADIGLIFVLVSAVPLPWAAYGAVFASTILWLLVEKSTREWWQKRRAAVRICVVACWLLAMLGELPYQFAPQVHGRDVHVIGDSITAGLGDKVIPWPKLLAEKRNLNVHSYARAGATTSQAIAQAETVPDDAEIVLVEIGGNDMLSSAPPEKFADDLDQLLTLVCQKSSQVIMFELPLPPLNNAYGRVQRELAARHNVRLIPKRVLMGVLSAGDATDDSVHLTQSGHEALAERASGMIAD